MSVDTLDLVRKLRERTGVGIMDCKAALADSGGDIEKAVDFLRKKGIAQAAKRAGREAKEGLVVMRVENTKAALVEANCETDFVARTDDFKQLASMALNEVFDSTEDAISSEKVSRRVAELSGKIGEKILVRRAKTVEAKHGKLFGYLHSNQKLAVVVELSITKASSADHAALAELGKNLAMQVAASNPVCVDRTQMPEAVVEREKAIFREEVKDKPANIVEKIIQGKLEKFYQSGCLLEQPFVKDDKKAVRFLIEETGKTIGDTVGVRQFVRMQLGEAAAG